MMGNQHRRFRRRRIWYAVGVLSFWAAIATEGWGEETGPGIRESLASYPHRIVFETNRDGNWELYLMNADGSGAVNLTHTPDVDELYPKASPDGRHIAFVADTTEKGKTVRDVYYMTIDGKRRIKIADDGRDPCWSPDGREIAYLPNEFGDLSYETWSTKGLRVHNLDNRQTRDHPNPSIEHLYTLTYTPDGRWFVATVHGGMGYRHDIVAIEVDGPRVRDLGLAGCRADVSPDGRRIIWGRGDFAIGKAWLELDQTEPRVRLGGKVVSTDSRGRWRRSAHTAPGDADELGTRAMTYHADLSPDGKYVVFSSGSKPRERSLMGGSAQSPGVDAPGWDIWLADVSRFNSTASLTTDGTSNKEPDWVPAVSTN